MNAPPLAIHQAPTCRYSQPPRDRILIGPGLLRTRQQRHDPPIDHGQLSGRGAVLGKSEKGAMTARTLARGGSPSTGCRLSKRGTRK